MEVRHLTHVFAHGSNHPSKAVDDVSFTMKKGEIFGLVGESGSGKSTVARCLMNIYQPSGGEIFLTGSISVIRKNSGHIEKCRRRSGRLFFRILHRV